MKGLAWFLAACLCWCAVSTPCFAAERQIARHQGLTASVDSGFGCARSASITVRAPEASAYTGDRIALQRLLGTVRAGLGADCPILNELDITGFADGDPVFQAAITADDGWRLPTGVGRILAENPLSPLARESARCDYERSDPFVGCWIGIDPERGRDMILNIRNDGTWYWDTPEKLALGEPVFDGEKIVHNYMYFVGQILTFVQKKGGFFDMVGPFFMAECNILKLNPYQLGGSQESQLFVRLHSPQWINADILKTGDSKSSDGFTGDAGNDEIVESLPEEGPLFNDCPDNFDENVNDEYIVSAILATLPIGRAVSLLPRAITTLPAFIPRLAAFFSKFPLLGSRLAFSIGSKIEAQMIKRGWSKSLIEDAIKNPSKTISTRDTRWLANEARNNEPATAFYSKNGGYVVRNNKTGDIVQISDRTDAGWKAPWEE